MTLWNTPHWCLVLLAKIGIGVCHRCLRVRPWVYETGTLWSIPLCRQCPPSQETRQVQYLPRWLPWCQP